MKWATITKDESNILKGLAILLIVTHNFMHLFPETKELEFQFITSKFFNLLGLFKASPENSLQLLLSFFGHFGVQIFIFLSAYGLTKKYKNQDIYLLKFIKERALKIYPTFILAIVFWLLIAGWLNHGVLGPLKLLYWNIEGLLLKLFLLSNFIPGKSLLPIGPWWFIPFIFQFYLIFPFLLKGYGRWGNQFLLFLSLCTFLNLILLNGHIADLNLYFTVLGHFPEFALGVYLANKDKSEIKFSKSILIPIIIVFILGNIYQAFWYFSHLSMLSILLIFFSLASKKIINNIKLKNFFIFYGSISMQLFLVNGFLRHTIINWAQTYDHWFITILLCLLSLSVSTLVALLLVNCEKLLRNKLKNFRLKKVTNNASLH